MHSSLRPGLGHAVSRAPQISAIALAVSLLFPATVHAAEYLVNNETALRDAITAANTNGDTSAVIKMTTNFSLTGGALPIPNMPLTIDTQGFVLTRASAATFSAALPSGSIIFNGSITGASGAGTAATNALAFTGSGIGTNTIVVNNGTLTGGNQTVANEGGRGISFSSLTFINNGMIRGGDSINFSATSAASNSAGVATAGSNVTVINRGTIIGGNSQGGDAGAGVLMAIGSELENSGVIRGGSDLNGGTGGGAALKVRGGATSVINTGTLEGGDGAAAITVVSPFSASLSLINSGIIKAGADAGAGRPNAITFGTLASAVATLELRAGSQIEGNVVASSAGANDVLKFGGSTNATFDATQLGDTQQYQFFDSFIKTGSSTWTLNGTSTGTGSWTIEEGKLALNGAVTGSMNVNAAGTLGGNATVTGDVTNSGIIAPGNSIGTVLINGNYTGNGGTLEMEGQFAGTGSPADKLLISGNATGTTTVKAINVGGKGAATGTGNTDGISIIQVAGTSSASAFQLAGGYVAAGPYQYKLNMFDPTTSAAGQADPLLGATPFYDYRLQSLMDASGNPVAVPQIAGYQGMSTGAVRYGASLLDSVHQRLGELRRLSTAGNGNDDGQNHEFFMRAQGSSSDVSGNHASGYDQDIWFTQAGGNVFGKDMEDGAKLRIGGAFSYGESKLNVDGSSAKVNLDGTSLALTSTYQAAAGWYLDGVAQLTKYSADIRTSERGQTGSPDGLGYALSLEGGYPFDLGGGLVIEPQAQLAYQKIKFDRFTDADGINVDLRDGESLRGRFGGRIQKTFDANTTRAWSPFVEANLLHEFLGNGSIRAGGVSFASDSLGTSVQLGGGINAQVGTNKMVFASVSYESGLSDAAADAWSGNVGMRIDF